MRQEQQLLLQQGPRLVLEAQCDFGIEPKPGTQHRLDHVLLDRVGRFVPGVILERSGCNPCAIGFDIDVSPHDWQKEAIVTFAQEEPHSPEVHVMIRFRDQHFEQMVLMPRLEPFLDFPYHEGEDGPEVDDEEGGFID